jgi:hypothetical protein
MVDLESWKESCDAIASSLRECEWLASREGVHVRYLGDVLKVLSGPLQAFDLQVTSGHTRLLLMSTFDRESRGRVGIDLSQYSKYDVCIEIVKECIEHRLLLTSRVDCSYKFSTEILEVFVERLFVVVADMCPLCGSSGMV